MRVSKLNINNFRCVNSAEIEFDAHTLLIGHNNAGKSTICEALDLALSSDRLNRTVEEFDFYNASYLDEKQNPIPIKIEVLLTDVTPSIQNACFNHLERWNPTTRKILTDGEIDQVDNAGFVWCLRLLTIARYNKDEDEFEVFTHYAASYDPENEEDSLVKRSVRRSIGFLYLRTLRTGSRALSLERGSLLDVILRSRSLHAGIWEDIRTRLQSLTPPISDGAKSLAPVLKKIEARLADYIEIANPGNATRLFASQLTREHLRKTISFFLSVTGDQSPVPFQNVGTGTLNTLVLALLSFIAEVKEENVIFAMEEPEIALPPHTQRRIAEYLLTKTTQCFVTSHSPYVIECFDPSQIKVLRRDASGTLRGAAVSLEGRIKAKTYHRYVRRGIAETMLGRGVIVVEGISEQLALQAISAKLEASDSAKWPLDIAGVTIFCADGDGSVSEFGKLFASLDISTFALLDSKKRNQTEQAALSDAGFKSMVQHSYVGLETLIAAEVPCDRQWAYLELVRIDGSSHGSSIPDVRPDDATIRQLTAQVLQSSKGWGRASELLELCAATELPATITSFFETVYAAFPRPKAETADAEEGMLPLDSPAPAATADAAPTSA